MRLNKNRELDKRYKLTAGLHRWFNRFTRASALSGLIVGSLLGCYIADNPKRHQNTSPQPLEQTISVKPIEIRAEEPLTWNDAIRQVFPEDEAGRMIRICLREHRGWKGDPKYALNDKNTNGTWDYGWCQVNSCHKPATMSNAEWKTYLEDPMNHAKEVRKIFLSQWWNAWTVFKNGSVR
jgi:hypothetical protein